MIFQQKTKFFWLRGGIFFSILFFLFSVNLVLGSAEKQKENPLIISNLRAEEHPTCDVCYIVRWETNLPAKFGLRAKERYTVWSES